MTIDEMNIRGIPGQEDLCLWLRKETTAEHFDLYTGKKVRYRYHRRCSLPRGHEGPHLIHSFLLDAEPRAEEEP